MKFKKFFRWKLSSRWSYFCQFLNGMAMNYEKPKNLEKSSDNRFTIRTDCLTRFQNFFCFFIICGHTVEKAAKIRPLKRQLSAGKLFWLHKDRPIRPLKWPFWRFVFLEKASIAQLLLVQSKSGTTHCILELHPLQKLCSAQWSTMKLILPKIELHVLCSR